MQRVLLCLAIAFPFFLRSQNTNFTLNSVVTFPGQSLANVWGYSAGGQEYALIGAQLGMQIYNITNPAAPVHVVTIPGPNNLWKEIKTYQNYAYVVSEGGMGVQVVNLANLPNSNLSYHSVYPNVTGEGTVTRVHALHVDEVKGFLYLYGSNRANGGPVVCNLNPDPYTPVYAGKYTADGYAHDGYANNDTMFAGHIYGGKFSIVNMTNKSAPAAYGPPVSTPNLFTHNTWRSGNTIFTTDEKNNSYLASYNIADPSDVVLMDQIQMTPGSGSVVHNTYIKNNYAVTSWYKDGVAIVDAARPANLVVTGKYDTYPGGSGGGFDGCWGVYPYFPSGRIIASNIYGTGANANTGELYILTPNYERGCYVEGQITNASTGQGLFGATVELLNSGVASETTPTGGLYKMARHGGGAFTLRVSKAGFMTQNIPLTLSAGVLTTANVALLPASLPVELLRFEAAPSPQNTALLQWQTATEINNLGFAIEYSGEGKNWTMLDFVPGAGTTNAEQTYGWESNPLDPGVHLFRLAQKDTDQKVQYSDWRSVTIKGTQPQALTAPNPTAGDATLQLSGPLPHTVTAINELQQVVWETTLPETESAGWQLNIPSADWPAGRYTLRLAYAHSFSALQLLKK